LEILLEKNSATEALIKIKLKEADYQPKFEEKLKTYSKQASIKGFRPGKVPVGLIKKMYGTSILVEEINKVLVDSLTKYIKENDIKIIGDPLPNNDKAKEIDWENQKEFEFEYNVGLIDDFSYDLDFKIDKYAIKVDKKTLDDGVKNLKEQYGKMENPEVSEENDSMFGVLSQSESEFSKDVLLQINKLTKKVKKQFIGAKKDDVIKTDIKSLFEKSEDLVELTNLTEDEVKALKGEFEFQVKNINRSIPADMDQEFFDKVFGPGKVKSEEEFVAEFTRILEENYDKESEYMLARDLQDKILEKTKVTIPEEFYKKWLLTTGQDIKEEDLEKDFEHYVRDLKWNLIKNRIASDTELKVENEDIVAYTKKMFKAQFGMNEIDEEKEAQLDVIANNYLQQNNNENYMNVYTQLRTEKIMETIKQKVNISVKKVSKEDFMKKASK
jgi:trigger factor